MRIRPATPADYEAIGELVVTVYSQIGPLHPDYAVMLRQVAERAAATELVVAEDGDGGLLGSLAFVDGPGPESSIAREGEAEFRTLAVAPAAQGHGVGRALVEWSVRRARELGRDRLVLSTMPWMTVAHGLYERMGFRRTPERDWAPRPGFDCLTYALDLPAGGS